MSTPPLLTDRTALLRNRSRASAWFLHDEAIVDVQERLAEVNRTFTSPAIVTGFPEVWRRILPGDTTLVADDETLELQPESHDLVVHAMGLHWANDPVGQLVQCRRALRPDGLFLGVCFGGQTLHQLRSVLAEAETETTQGLSPRIAPMAEIRDLGALLQRAGFALPVADSIPHRVSYDSTLALMRDLKAMGEGNALAARLRHPSRRQMFARAEALYRENFQGADGRLLATFEMIFLTGWAPSADQPKALRPGSASARLAEALGTKETKLKD